MGKQTRRSKKTHAAQLQLIGHIGQRCRECGQQFNTLDDLKYVVVLGDDVTCGRCASGPGAGGGLMEVTDGSN